MPSRRRAPVIPLFLGTLACGSAVGQSAEPAEDPVEEPVETPPPLRPPRVDRIVSLEPGKCVVVYAQDCPRDQAECPAEIYGKEAIDCPRSLQSQASERQLVARGGGCEARAVSSCPPGARCNPPRPERLAECPEKLRPRIEKNDDGTCWEYPVIQCPVSCDGCAPVPTCNPPAPRKVDCP